MDTITFQDGVATYNLTKTGATTTIDTITFDGSADTLNTITSDGTNAFTLTKNQAGATTTLDALMGKNSIKTIFDLKDSNALFTPADPNNLTVTRNGLVQYLNSDYTVSGSTISFDMAPYMMDTISLEYTTVVEVNVTPAATESLDVTVDGTPVPSSDYTVSGSQIEFDDPVPTSQVIAIDHITGSTTYDLTEAGTTNTLDPLMGRTGMNTTFSLRDTAMLYTPANANYLTVTQNGATLTLGTDYTVSGSQITFTMAPPMMDSISIGYTDRVAYVPTVPGDVKVIIDGVTQALNTDYTISGSEITFDEVKQASVTMTSIAETDVAVVSPAAAADLSITIDGMLVDAANYTISGSTVVFDAARSASETLTAITHSTGATMTSIAETDVAVVSPAAAADLSITIDGMLVDAANYTISGSTVVFDAARSASET